MDSLPGQKIYSCSKNFGVKLGISVSFFWPQQTMILLMFTTRTFVLTYETFMQTLSPETGHIIKRRVLLEGILWAKILLGII